MKELLIKFILVFLSPLAISQTNNIISVSQPNCKDANSVLAPIWPNVQGFYPYLNYDYNIYPTGVISNNQVALELIYEQNFNGSTSDLIGNWMPSISRATNQNDGLRPPAGISYAYNLIDPNQDCIDVSNGTLKLWAREIPPTEYRCVDYLQDSDQLADGFPNKREFKATAGEIWTLDMFKHGYFEAMIKLPYVDYVWPAFWLFHSANGKKTEIDIFEFVNESRGDHCSPVSAENLYFYSDNMLMTVHDWSLSVPPYDEFSIEHVCRGFTGHAINNFHFFNTWHKFGLYWDEYKCIWLVDEVPIAYLFKYYKYFYDQNPSLDLDYSLGIWDYSELSNYYGPVYRNMGFPNDECHVILGMAVPNFGGKFNSDPSLNQVCLPSGNTLPRFMEVDYLRVYSNRSCASDFTVCNETHLPTKIVANSVALPDPSQGSNCEVVVRNEHQIKLEAPYNYHPTEILSDAQKVEVVANEEIKLYPGFRTEPGATFYARIDNCSTADLRKSESGKPSFSPQQMVLQLTPDMEDNPKKSALDYALSITPNPSDGNFTIHNLNNKSSIQIVDLSGRVVFYQNKIETNTMNLDLSFLANGTYYIKAIDNSGNFETVIWLKQ